MFVSALAATEGGSATLPAKIIQILVSTISVAFKIPQHTICDAVSAVYAAVTQPLDASSATSATTPDNRHHSSPDPPGERVQPQAPRSGAEPPHLRDAEPTGDPLHPGNLAAAQHHLRDPGLHLRPP